jgi:hypothetical protein
MYAPNATKKVRIQRPCRVVFHAIGRIERSICPQYQDRQESDD